jgi:hypothetical protein
VTLQHLIDLLQTLRGTTPLTDLALTRTLLLAYELGREAGRQDAPHAKPRREEEGC